MSIHHTKRSASSKRNSLGMDGQVYKHLLDKLAEINGKPLENSGARFYTRLEYLDPYLELSLESNRKITVATRNISRGGMSVLHASYIYPDTHINAQLHRADGSSLNVSGTVCRCTHRGGVVHEIGIAFDSQIIVQEFIKPDINDSIKSLESVNPKDLKGKAIFVGSDKTLVPFLREYLINTNINFGFVDSAKEAIEKGIEQYDLVFSCLDADDMTGPEFARYLREHEYRKPIILSGRAQSEFMKHQIRLSTADMFLPVPITETSLMCTLGEFLLTEWSEKTLVAVRSGIDKDTVRSVRTELTKLGILLGQQIHSEDPVKVYATCSSIRSLAPLLGMKKLRDLTLNISEEVASTGDLQKFEKGLSTIMLLCKGTRAAA